MRTLGTRRAGRCLAGLLLAVVALGGAARADWAPDPESKRQVKSAAAVERIQRKMPKTERFFDEAHGYAIFHSVTRFGFGIGGAYGRGVVVEQDEVIANTSFWQFTSGIQAGAEVVSIIVFFKDEETLEYYKLGKLEFLGQAGFSLAKLGAMADPAYHRGVAIFTLTKGGLMGQATISGAKLTYKPLPE